MEKQTATEWLFDKLWDVPRDKFNWFVLLKQAENMEKEQIEDAFKIGYNNGACVNDGEDIYHGANYYNQTFKKD